MTIELDPRYWDCECEHDYIHPKSMECCPKCKAWRDDQPDSRVEEVLKYKTTTILRKAAENAEKNAEADNNRKQAYKKIQAYMDGEEYEPEYLDDE